MKLDFRIDWGYQYLYSRRHYHPQYLWDGGLTVDQGAILETYQLEYPIVWYGIGISAIETKLEKPEWKSYTKRRLAGARFVAEVPEDAVFTLQTVTATVQFTAGDIMEKGRIEFPVGPKYLQCGIIVTRTDYYWFRKELPEGTIQYEEKDLGLPVHTWARTRLAFLEPGQSCSVKVQIPESKADYTETLMHLIAMGAPRYSLPETPVDTYIPMELYCDGKLLMQFRHFFRQHDAVLQILEDLWKRFSLEAGEHVIELKNCHEEVCLAISRISFTQKEYNHGQLSIPEWALTGETVHGAVYAAWQDVVTIETPKGAMALDCQVGWNEFPICIKKLDPVDVMEDAEEPVVLPPSQMFAYTTEPGTAYIEILDYPEEERPVKVGYDMTQICHDETGELDWLLEYTQRTRLGNYALFRNFTGECKADDELLHRWGRYCREHGIYVGAATDYMSGTLIESSSDYFHDCGRHEFSGMVYAHDPKPHLMSEDMKQATEGYQKYLKEEIDKVHAVSPSVAFGDASGGIRHAFIAGADFIRAETMVGHTMTLLSQARPAAEALGNGGWGVHIAIQHAKEPYYETHLGEYFLSIMQPWMMGAEVIYEEDSLFGMWSEERMCWDDLLVKGKRDMTRNFYKFAKTHPRQGRNVRNIAFLEGRYGAPFNGFICDVEQDPHYSVWGAFGNPASEWGHGQPEKCRQLLDVLMPGAATLPLRQKFDKRRFFFSGTPYGDFDCIPVEASSAYFNQYKLMLNLGWNTLIEEDYVKLLSYVENGGILLTGLPQCSTHVKRDFLRDMEDLSLWNNGDLTELCGIRVLGRDERYSGQWNCAGRETMKEPQLSALPSDDPHEDGDGCLATVELAGAEIIAWDAFNGKPMLVRHKVGKGFVYTFTLWAYPGHEEFQKFCAAWIQKLAAEAQPALHVEDPTGEIFWTRWEEEAGTTLMLLNTDWSRKGNEKLVTIVEDGKSWILKIRERTAVLARMQDGQLMVEVAEV